MTDYRPYDHRGTSSRRTRRLTFQSNGADVRLVSEEALEMICPPSVGERPEAGKNSGFWVELHDDAGDMKFFRVLHDPIRSSVEVHSPDGNIRREFGPAEDTTFEVLVPDDPKATVLVLMGDYEDPRTVKKSKRKTEASTGAHEMARFDLAHGDGPVDDSEQGS